MADVEEFEENESKPGEDQANGVSERKMRSLLKKQLVDDASVAAFAQLGSSFFAAARARLGDSRDESGAPTAESVRTRHQRLAQDARLAAGRGQWDLRDRQPSRPSEDGEAVQAEQEEQARVEAERLARLSRLDAKRKRLQGGEGPGEDHESKASGGVRRPRLSFAGEEDDF
ncbi:unnamed protein product [Symbiodinium necroappetens]|uniref:Uncharacterized protein n=1 Tax=Symbiodinium necroappetens TaxID=1628268 RepID=A0A812VEQ9_9DINO|nr:unnamed protein product [Symbiodinium necroappetens]